MRKYADAMLLRLWLGLQAACGRLKDEKGDTNLISIIIVLGIVLALVVVFRGYITSIIGKIASSVGSFTNDGF